MRIISQDGCIDLPYENIALHREDGMIIAEVIGSEDGYVIAEYADERHAGSEMIRLRQEYELGHTAFKFKDELSYTMRKL